MKKKIIRFLIELLVGALLAIVMIGMVFGASIQEAEKLRNETYAERN